MKIPDLQPGDIFLSRNPMALGIAINAVQRFWSTDDKSEYSHAGIIIHPTDKTTTLEALSTVKSQTIKKDYQGEKVLIARHKKMRLQHFINGYYTINKHKSQWYPAWRLLFMIIPPLGKYINFGRVVCSELVCKFLAGTGLYEKMVWKGKNPDNIHDMVKNWDDWEIIFEDIVK